MTRTLKIFFSGLTVLLSFYYTKNLMEYYYPINQKYEVKIFQYINPLNNELTEYWKTTTDPTERSILTESYDSQFQLYNTFKEKVSPKEATLIKYVEYEGERRRKEINATIKKDKVYKSTKTLPYSYMVEYVNEYGRFNFEKKRQFKEFLEIEIQGIKYRTAKFEDEYFIHAIDQNDKYQFKQSTYYAEGIGMVKYERFIPTGEIRVLELEKIMTNREFEELKKKTTANLR